MEDNSLNMEDYLKEIDSSMRRLKEGEVVKGTVLSVNEDEIAVNINYISDGIIEKDETGALEDESLVDLIKPGDKITAVVLKINDGEGNVLLSKKKADLLNAYEEVQDIFNKGKIVNVTVKEIVKGGVVAYLKGMRAFIPMSQLSVNYVDDAEKYLNKNIDVKVIEYEEGGKKLILSSKVVEKEKSENSKAEMWQNIENVLNEGDILEGEVTKVLNFGAFVKLKDGLEGLVHESEFANGKNIKLDSMVKPLEKLKVKVNRINKKDKKISLCLVHENEEEKIDLSKYNAPEEGITLGDIFKDKFKNLEF